MPLMIAKRIIPCLDIKNGRVVKGVRFQNLEDVDDPVALAERYNAEGGDEIVFYDITASFEGRKLFTEVLERVASRVFIPLMVGGGVDELSDFDRLLKCGADKVSVNSGAVKNPALINKAAEKYGSQCVVLSVDVKREGGALRVYTNGGRKDTGLEAVSWIKEGAARGAGEVVLNSMDADGVKNGFDIASLREVSEAVGVPVVASGGAGKKEDFLNLYKGAPGVSAYLAASVFHFGEIKIPELKKYLGASGVPIRI